MVLRLSHRCRLKLGLRGGPSANSVIVYSSELFREEREMSEFFKREDHDPIVFDRGALDLKGWISLDKANRLLRERSVQAYGFIDTKFYVDPDLAPDEYKFQARVFAIEPLERDSAEKIVERLTQIRSVEISASSLLQILEDLIDRAKKIRDTK